MSTHPCVLGIALAGLIFFLPPSPRRVRGYCKWKGLHGGEKGSRRRGLGIWRLRGGGRKKKEKVDEEAILRRKYEDSILSRFNASIPPKRTTYKQATGLYMMPPPDSQDSDAIHGLVPFPASLKEHEYYARRHEDRKTRAYRDAIIFDERTDLLPHPYDKGRNYESDVDPYGSEDIPPPEPGAWQNLDRNKTYWGHSTYNVKELDEYMEEIRDPRLMDDPPPLEGYTECKRNLLHAMKTQDMRIIREAIDDALQFSGLHGYIMEAEVMLHQLEAKEEYTKYKLKKGFLKQRVMTIHFDDIKSLKMAKENQCRELTITCPETQYQILNLTEGVPNGWLELAGCEREIDGTYNVMLANNSQNRALRMEGLKMSEVKPEFIRKKPLTLAPEVCHIYSLRRLRVITKGGNLTRLPENIHYLENLKELDISNNGLRELPERFFKLKKLKILDIGNNLLEDLDQIARLENIEVLHAAGNRFITIVNLNGCLKLKYINVDHNDIGPELGLLFADFLKNVEFLSFADNKVEVFPEGVHKLSELKVLNASHNRIKSLPMDLAQLDPAKIKEFRLQKNKLQDQARVERILSMDKPATALIWYMKSKAARRLYKAQTRMLHNIESKDLKYKIDEVALNEDLDSQLGEEGLSCLHVAAWLNEAKLVEALIGQGANIEVRDSLMNTPLHYARAKSNEEAAQVLISAGADETVLNKYNITPEGLEARNLNFLVDESPGGHEESDAPRDAHGVALSGLNLQIEATMKKFIGRLWEVPPIPRPEPSETERMLNISHTCFTSIPITRMMPGDKLEDATSGRMWDWLCEQFFETLRMDPEEEGFGPWLKDQVRRLQALLKEENYVEKIQQEFFEEPDDPSDLEPPPISDFDLLLHEEDAVNHVSYRPPETRSNIFIEGRKMKK
ncbi:hypothetical protein AAMO2058_000468800 [Amorphochlora amoebiformis]